MTNEKIKALHRNVTPYTKPNNKTSYLQLVNTILPLIALWILSYVSIQISILLAVVCAILASGFVVRTFIIFHDCTHGSFFHNKKLNDLLGTITGIITLFPYEKWKREHAIHHASSSNLDKRGIGDIWVMTIEEYVQASAWKRFGYRIYRNPFVMFGLGPLYLVLISNRCNRKDARKKEKINTYITNASILVLYSSLMYIVGWQAFLLVHGVTMYIAAMLGICLFYIQHTFEDSYFEEEPEWHYVKAAVEGSSYYKLPRMLQWLTGNIGFHHVHHLAPRVPNYRLEEAHESIPPLQKATTITLKTSLQSLKYRLYDPERKTFVTFKSVQHVLNDKKRQIKMDEIKPRRTSLENK